MLRSMTGFGSGRADALGSELVVEVRAVNSKSCDVRARLPRELSALEPRVHALVRERVARGRVEISVERVDGPTAVHRPRLDLATARGYAAVFDELAASLGVTPSAESKLALLWTAPGVIGAPILEASEAWGPALDRAVGSALSALDEMRAREGAALLGELERLLSEMDAAVAAIRAELPRATAERAERTRARASELARDAGVDPVRVAQEIALLAERADVTEELARIASHRAQLDALFAGREPAGRRLDFLLQEMQRETNTLGAKSSSAFVSHRVVDAKAVLDRLREQAQNVE